MSDFKAEGLAYLRGVIEATGRTPTELARLALVSPTTLTRPLSKVDHKSAIKFQTLAAIAEKTGIPLPATLVAANRDTRSLPKELRLAIRHEVAASGFLARDDLPQVPYGYRRVAPVSPYEFEEQWLERVISDSMDKLIPVGAEIHVVDAEGLRYTPRHNDIVVVERTRDQGALVERTVKQIAITPDGQVELWPRSHNPRWNAPIQIASDSDDPEHVTVHIAGLVIRAYLNFHEPPERGDDPKDL